MSRLEELIAELCPDGVEYFQLKTLCTRQKGTAITAGEMKSLNKPNAPIRIFAGGNTTAYVEYGDIPDSAVITNPSVIVKSRGNIGFEYYEKPFSHKNEMWSYSTARDDVDLKYVYYYLEHHTLEFQAKAKSGKLPQISTPDTDNYKIPLPPLEVQSEIVRILDTFTELTAELSAELDARKKQYEYYRDDLCDFTDRPDVPFIPVGELFEFKNGLNKEKEFFGKGSPIVNFTDVFNNRWMTKETLKGLVEVTDKEKELYGAKKNDVFFTRTSETQEEIGMTSVLLDEIEGCVFSGFVLRARPKTDLLLPKFCSYCFSSYSMRKDIVRYSTFTTRALTSGSKLSKLMFPVPPLAEQERIVSILDRFDKLCNDISAGIPAEIEARCKQYEYYRDLLLTFKEKSA